VTVTRRSALGGGGGGTLRSGFVLCAGFWVGLSLYVNVNVAKKHIGWLAMLRCNILHWAFWVMRLQVGDELSLHGQFAWPI